MNKQDNTKEINAKAFFAALNELEASKGISKDVIIETIKNTVISACKKQHSGCVGEVQIVMDEEKCIFEIYTVKKVVSEVIDREKELSVEEAKKIDSTKEDGDEIRELIDPLTFSRVAAQAAKQVLMQKIRETERETAMNLVNDKEGSLIQGTVRKIDGKNNIYVNLGVGQVEGVLKPSDQVSGESYKVGDRIKVFVKKVKTVNGGASIVVSRSSQYLVSKLFEEEVPEIREGVVVIKSVSREAGARSKMAIYTEDERVDAIGACVGNRGSRVNAVVAELNGEKIDIVPWSENPLEFIAKALSPAKVISVTQTGDKSAMVIVPDDKLSLAIGKDGQNARLAVRLTGWKIDVKSKSVAIRQGVMPIDESEDVEE